jgi:nicotinate dehydrogenase subunit A
VTPYAIEYATIGHMSQITLTVNGRRVRQDVDAAMPLLYLLIDDLALRGPKLGCGLAQCGACMVIVNGAAIPSCVPAVGTLDGAEITTLEGLGSIERPHPIQQAFIDEQASQCGFCLNGVILTAKAFLDRNPRASDAQIREALSNVLCRCGANVRMLRAIRRYADRKVTA